MVNLTYLDLRENKITDLSALEPLTELRSLNLRQNEISDLSPLAGMTQMEERRLGSGNNGNAGISDLSSGQHEKSHLSLPAPRICHQRSKPLGGAHQPDRDQL